MACWHYCRIGSRRESDVQSCWPAGLHHRNWAIITGPPGFVSFPVRFPDMEFCYQLPLAPATYVILASRNPHGRPEMAGSLMQRGSPQLPRICNAIASLLPEQHDWGVVRGVSSTCLLVKSWDGSQIVWSRGGTNKHSKPTLAWPDSRSSTAYGWPRNVA